MKTIETINTEVRDTIPARFLELSKIDLDIRQMIRFAELCWLQGRFSGLLNKDRPEAIPAPWVVVEPGPEIQAPKPDLRLVAAPLSATGEEC